jgi:hypothetical protein
MKGTYDNDKTKDEQKEYTDINTDTVNKCVFISKRPGNRGTGIESKKLYSENRYEVTESKILKIQYL